MKMDLGSGNEGRKKWALKSSGPVASDRSIVPKNEPQFTSSFSSACATYRLEGNILDFRNGFRQHRSMQNDVTDSTMQKFPHGTRVYLRIHRHDKPGEVTGGPTNDGFYIVHWDDESQARCVHEDRLISEEEALTENLCR